MTEARRWYALSSSEDPPLLRWRRRLLAVGVVAVILSGAYLLWLRDLPLFGIEQVRVTGLRTDRTGAIQHEFERAARNMTSLHPDRAALERVAARFPVIRSLSARTEFPDRLLIEVVERGAAAVLQDPTGKRVAIDAGGVVLEGVRTDGLPVLGVSALPEGEKVRDDDVLRAIAVATAAPVPLGSGIESVETPPSEPIEVRLEGGVKVIFGDSSALEAKWQAVAATLADPALEELSYIDVTLPERPVAGRAREH